jgi:DNA-binding beta-propeller fold protein YncE
MHGAEPASDRPVMAVEATLGRGRRRAVTLGAACAVLRVSWPAVLWGLLAAGLALALAPYLEPLPGRDGCVTQGRSEDCRAGRALESVSGMVVSGDGRHVYAAVRDSGAVAAFRRNGRTGALHQLAGRRGCVGGAPADGCAAGRNLAGARALTLSPDGRSVYVATAGGLAVLARDRRTGALRQLAGRDGCVTESGREGCATGRAVASALWVAAGRESRSLYLLGRSDAVAVFRRDPRSGAVRQPGGARGCVRELRPGLPSLGCAPGRGLGATRAAAITRSGRTLYVGGLDGAVATFRRNPRSGAIAQQPGRRGCLASSGLAGCAPARGLHGPHSLTVGPGERDLYVTVSLAVDPQSGVVLLRRDRRDGSLTQPPGQAGCVNADGSSGCASGRGLRGAHSLELDPSGRRAVLASELPTGSLALFARDPASGRLRQLDGARGCLNADGAESCGVVPALRGAHLIVPAPGWRQIYVPLIDGDGVVALRVQP